MEDTLGSEDFGTSLDGSESIINDDEESTAKDDHNEEEYQVIPYSPEIDDIIDNSNK